VVGLEAVLHYSADAVFVEVSVLLICCCGWDIPSLPECQPTFSQVFQLDWESTGDGSLSVKSQPGELISAYPCKPVFIG
jgi:hypothetical protein